MSNIRFAKLVIVVNALVPLALLLWDVLHHNVGANPQEFAIRTTGMLTLVFLTLTIAITPLRKTFGANSLIKFRRMLGLFAFFYGFLHLTTYIWFDRLFSFVGTVKDVAQRPFILVGMAGFLLMVPLAITSTNKMIKRLGGKRWSLLHRLVYVSVAAGVVHFWMLVKSDTRLPLTFAFIVGLLLAQRLLVKYAPESRPNGTAIFPRE
ncbi:MAG TPA: protein-methionine-sulfoxide reductase heme-binding subunit MsrQ [Pyrinomonadaceae bacterium]